MAIPFEKWHGTGNDFVVIDETTKVAVPEKKKAEFAKEVCDRHFGIGADGVLFISKSSKADLRMRMLNPDGSEAEMCGNGIRCFAKYVHEKGLVSSKKMRVETLAGIIEPEIVAGGLVRVKMGAPILEAKKIPMQWDSERCIDADFFVDNEVGTVKLTAVSMGNPHAVIFVDSLESVDLKRTGRVIENHYRFPKKTNVHFVKVHGKGEIEILHWERGAGATLACGTGTVASAVAAFVTGRTERLVKARVPGGILHVEIEGSSKQPTQTYMLGPAVRVFSGEYSG